MKPGDAISLLRRMTQAKDHRLWEDTLDITDKNEMLDSHLVGHRQVTDAYLLALAIQYDGKLATLDGGITALLPDPILQSKHLELIIQLADS